MKFNDKIFHVKPRLAADPGLNLDQYGIAELEIR